MTNYQPQQGQMVRVRRYRIPGLATDGQVPVEDRTGRVAAVTTLAGDRQLRVFYLEGEEDHIAPGYVFLGGSPAMYLVTTVELVVQHQIRITVRGDRAVVSVVGDQPLPPGRYAGTVTRLTGSLGEVA